MALNGGEWKKMTRIANCGLHFSLEIEIQQMKLKAIKDKLPEKCNKMRPSKKSVNHESQNLHCEAISSRTLYLTQYFLHVNVVSCVRVSCLVTPVM